MARWNQNTNQPNESLIAPYSLCREGFYPEKTNTSKSNTNKVLPSWINTEKLEVQLPRVCSVGHCSIAELYAIPHRQLNEYLGAFTVVSWRCESRISTTASSGRQDRNICIKKAHQLGEFYLLQKNPKWLYTMVCSTNRFALKSILWRKSWQHTINPLQAYWKES